MYDDGRPQYASTTEVVAGAPHTCRCASALCSAKCEDRPPLNLAGAARTAAAAVTIPLLTPCIAAALFASHEHSNAVQNQQVPCTMYYHTTYSVGSPE